MYANRPGGIRLKIERAEKHITELDSRITDFALVAYELGAKPHAVLPSQTTVFVKTVAPVPPDFSVIVGDAVHNLRSALDHLMWQLVEAGGGSPNKSTYFRICRDPQGAHQYASAVGSGEIQKIKPGAASILQSVQPYMSGNDTLWHIHELDRFDKHRTLVTVLNTFKEWFVDQGVKGSKIVFPESPKIALVANYEVFNIPTATYEREPHENFKLNIDLSFGQSEVVGGQSVLPTLKEMMNLVDRLVTQFEPFLL
jgi:hypothetical protein